MEKILILRALIVAFVINGAHYAFSIGNILAPIRDLLFNLISKNSFYARPLTDCIVCMSSVWGCSSFFMFYGINNLELLPVFILMVAGINSIINKIAVN